MEKAVGDNSENGAPLLQDSSLKTAEEVSMTHEKKDLLEAAQIDSTESKQAQAEPAGGNPAEDASSDAPHVVKEESEAKNAAEGPGGDEKSASEEGRQHRMRKQVQRFSETLSKRYEDEQAAREKAHDEVVAQCARGSGTPLGDIPRIEASIRKWKPVDLKTLHLACFGRAGAASEVRSNLRKFCGFAFDRDSEDFSKREQALSKKPVKEVQNALRQLNLEVSGTRAQVVARLLDFLLKPSSDMVKYKGKCPPSKRKSTSGRRSLKKNDSKKNTKSPSKPKSGASGSEEDNQSGGSEEADPSDAEAEDVSEKLASSDDAEYVPGSNKKRKSSVHTKSPRRKRRKAAVVESSDEEGDEKVESDEDEEDEVPLAKMLPPAPAFPSDDELKSKVVEWLKTANLNETSMKAVRSAISDQYKGVDLSSKKQFINDVIKEYLSTSL